MANILQIAVPTGTPALCWPARSDPSVNSLLFINQDLTNTVYIGQMSSIYASSPNTIPIPPNGTFSGDPSSAWYVIGSTAGIQPLVMVPNGQNFFRGLSQGGGNLALPQFQSPNYVPGVSGWAVFKNGHAEFNDVVIRNGAIVGGSSLIYSSSTPAANTLLSSVSTVGVAFQDSVGNWVLPGSVSYGPDTIDGSGYVAIQQIVGQINFFLAPSMTGPFSWATGNSIGYSNLHGLLITSSGFFGIQDDLDSNFYNPEKFSYNLTANTASLTALTQVFSYNCGNRNYRTRVRAYANVAVANAQLNTEIVAPFTASGQMGVSIYRGTTFYGSVAGPVNNANGIAVNLPAANGYIIDLDATIAAGGGGVVSVQFGSLTAQGIVITAYSSLDMWPE